MALSTFEFPPERIQIVFVNTVPGTSSKRFCKQYKKIVLISLNLKPSIVSRLNWIRLLQIECPLNNSYQQKMTLTQRTVCA
jgi:hypothetical protein